MYSQLTVSNYGYVGIGIKPEFKFHIDLGNDKAVFNTWTNTYIDDTGLCFSTSIYPQQDWYLQLGKWGNRIGNIFAYGIHTGILWTNAIQNELHDSNNDNDKTNEGQTSGSDEIFEIEKIDNSTNIINQITSYKYKFSESYLDPIPVAERYKYNRYHYGFLADEIQNVLPDLVLNDESGKTSINYNGFIPILVNSFQQQNKLLLVQNQYIKELNQKLNILEEIVYSCCNDGPKIGDNSVIDKKVNLENDKNSCSLLYQNNPNPFNKETEIDFYIDKKYLRSSIYIFDLMGQLINEYKILEANIGLNSIKINAFELKAGMYIYSLICDGIEVDSKRMILTNN